MSLVVELHLDNNYLFIDLGVLVTNILKRAREAENPIAALSNMLQQKGNDGDLSKDEMFPDLFKKIANIWTQGFLTAKSEALLLTNDTAYPVFVVFSSRKIISTFESPSHHHRRY
jgi:hypothetical protein